MKVAVLGLGNVGLNLVSIMKDYGSYHRSIVGEQLDLAAVGDFKNTLYSDEGMDIDRIVYYKRKGDLWGAGYTEIEREDIFQKDIDIVVDVTTASRTGDFGRDLYLSSFRNGMDVATASKSPLANHWSLIMNEAEKSGRSIRYESTVAGGVPLFSFLDYCINASPVASFRGIVNGTANFVLSEISGGLPMEDSIEKAREMGIAEADASLDIDGYDNAWKSLIVANRLSSRPMGIAELKFEGIRDYIDRTGKIESGARLVSEVNVKDGIAEISARVKSLDRNDPLASIESDSLGYFVKSGTNEVSVTGFHDGPRETAAGVMNDVLLLARGRKSGT